MNFVRAFAILFLVFSVMSAALAIDMGNAWIHVGRGINPWIAYPSAALMLTFPVVVVFWAFSARTAADDYFPPLDL